MRVLHCLYDDRRNPWVAGGGAVRAHEIYRRLADRVDATVLTGDFPGARPGEEEGVRYERAGVTRPYALSRWSYARRATRRLAADGYDVGIYDFSVYTPIRIPAPPAPVGIVVHHVTGPTARDRWGGLLGRLVERSEARRLARGRWFEVPSEWTRERLSERVAPDAQIRVVGNGVANRLFGYDRRPDGSLLYFGRMDLYQKGLDTLLEAFARLARDRPGLELRLAGRGKDGAAVAALARRAGVADRVRLLGAVDEPMKRELLETAELLLMPSRFEGWGMVAAEAMAAAVPVVATRAGSLPEVVGDAGVLVAPGDAGALAAAVSRLLDAEPAARRRLGEASRQLARRRFSWDVVAEGHLSFLRHVHEDARRQR